MALKCPNCSYAFRNGNICPDCGVDSKIYCKTKHVSNKLYNKGLAQAKAGDISSAIESLLQSITFDKMNYKARNLLGLTYFESGRIPDALMHWIISSSLNKEDNAAKEYIDSLQNNARILEKINDAIKMYNQALTYINQKSVDLAVIQLKKAVDFNPKFVEGYNLLTLCYISQNDYTKANTCIDKVLSMDKNNLKALYYLREINPTKFNNENRNKNTINSDNSYKSIRAASSYRYPERKRAVIGRTEVIAFIVGIICTSAVLMTLIVPAWVDQKSKTIEELQTKVDKLEKESENGSTKFAASYKALQDENVILKAENDKFKTEGALQDKVNKIQQAIDLMSKNDSEGAALLIADVDISALPDEELAKYNEIKEKSYPKAAQSFYNTGRSQFLNSKHEEAMGNLENSLKFANGENFVDDSIYYLAKIAESKGNNEKAKNYYQRIIDEFPQSNQYKNAKNSLGTLLEN